jgi:hypothetical protein
MKRISLVLGAWILIPLLAFAVSHLSVPWPDTVIHHVPYIIPVTEFLVTVTAFVVGFLVFELIYHGPRRSLFRDFYNRVSSVIHTQEHPLAEVQRRGRGMAVRRH